MTSVRMKEVFDFCSNHRLPIIEDDAYVNRVKYNEKIYKGELNENENNSGFNM